MTSPSKKFSSSVAKKTVKVALPAEFRPRSVVPIDESVEALDPFDAFLPLVEAAHHAGKDPQELIQAAENEEIEVVFECPPELRVVLQAGEPIVEGKEFAAADILRTPEYLVVRPNYCRGWKNRSVVRISEAAVGYRKSHSATMLDSLLPGKAHQEWYALRFLGHTHRAQPDRYEVDIEGIRWVRWVLWANDASVQYAVRPEDLLVRKKAFRSWMGWDKTPKPTTGYLPEQFKLTKVELGGDDFLSPQLLRMCEAAHKFWGQDGLVRDNPRTYPSEEAIIEFLMDSDAHFSGTAAKEAARLIKPRFAQQSGPRPK